MFNKNNRMQLKYFSMARQRRPSSSPPDGMPRKCFRLSVGPGQLLSRLQVHCNERQTEKDSWFISYILIWYPELIIWTWIIYEGKINAEHSGETWRGLQHGCCDCCTYFISLGQSHPMLRNMGMKRGEGGGVQICCGTASYSTCVWCMVLHYYEQ